MIAVSLSAPLSARQAQDEIILDDSEGPVADHVYRVLVMGTSKGRAQALLVTERMESSTDGNASMHVGPVLWSVESPKEQGGVAGFAWVWAAEEHEVTVSRRSRHGNGNIDLHATLMLVATWSGGQTMGWVITGSSSSSSSIADPNSSSNGSVRHVADDLRTDGPKVSVEVGAISSGFAARFSLVLREQLEPIMSMRNVRPLHPGMAAAPSIVCLCCHCPEPLIGLPTEPHYAPPPASADVPLGYAQAAAIRADQLDQEHLQRGEEEEEDNDSPSSSSSGEQDEEHTTSDVSRTATRSQRLAQARAARATKASGRLPRPVGASRPRCLVLNLAPTLRRCHVALRSPKHDSMQKRSDGDAIPEAIGRDFPAHAGDKRADVNSDPTPHGDVGRERVTLPLPNSRTRKTGRDQDMHDSSKRVLLGGGFPPGVRFVLPLLTEQVLSMG